MQLPEIIQSGVYHFPIAFHPQKVYHFWLDFYVRGAIRYQVYRPDGTLRFKEDDKRKTELVLFAPGERIEHEFSSKRENWVVMFSSPDIVFDQKTRQFQLKDGDFTSVLPDRIPVLPWQIAAIREHLIELTSLINDSLPEKKYLAQTILQELLMRYFLVHAVNRRLLSPAEHFKQLIDDDENWKFSLEELAKQCGYSFDYLRQMFLKEYHILPIEYRNNHRMQVIMQKIIYTRYSIKEIAESVGISYVSYLNILLKRHYGKSPGELCRMFR